MCERDKIEGLHKEIYSQGIISFSDKILSKNDKKYFYQKAKVESYQIWSDQGLN